MSLMRLRCSLSSGLNEFCIAQICDICFLQMLSLSKGIEVILAQELFV